MKSTFAALVAAGLVAAAAPAAAQTVIFEDDFEAYNDNADVTATDEWEAFTADAELVTDEEAFSGTNAIKEPTTSGSLTGGHDPVDPADITADTHLVVSFMYFDADADTGGAGIGLRSGLSYGSYENGSFGDGDLNNFLAIGVNHHDVGDETYGGRVVFGGDGWTAFDGEGDTAEILRETGWREMQIRITPDDVSFYVDGVLAATDTYGAVPAWDSMRLGAFAGTAQSLDIYFDDFSVVLEEEEVSVEDWHMF